MVNPQAGVVGQVGGVVQRTADAHVHTPRTIDQPLLRGAAERRAVRVGRPEVGVPGVKVRVEVHHSHRAVPTSDGTQQRQRDRVVAAEGEQAPGPLGQRIGAALHLRDRLLDRKRVHGDVPGVDDLEPGERRDADSRVVRPQQSRGLAHVGRPEAGPRSVADARVEGDAEDGHVEVRHFVEPGQSGEGGRSCEAWDQAGVDRTALPVGGHPGRGSSHAPAGVRMPAASSASLSSCSLAWGAGAWAVKFPDRASRYVLALARWGAPPVVARLMPEPLARC